MPNQPANVPVLTSASTYVPIKHTFVNIPPSATIQELRDNTVSSLQRLVDRINNQLKNIQVSVSTNQLSSTTAQQQVLNTINQISQATAQTNLLQGTSSSTSNVGLQYPLEYYQGQIAIAPQGISQQQMGASSVAALQLATNAVTDAKVLSAGINKLIASGTSGTNVFTGPVYLVSTSATDAAVLLTNTGFFAFGTASSTTGPFSAVTPSQVGVFGGTSTATLTYVGGTTTLAVTPSFTVTPTQATMWFNNGVTSEPYMAFTAQAIQMVYGTFTSALSGVALNMYYGTATNGSTGPAMQLNSTQLLFQAGSCTSTLQSNLFQITASTNTFFASPSQMELTNGTSTILMTAGTISLGTASSTLILTPTTVSMTNTAGVLSMQSSLVTIKNTSGGTTTQITLDGSGNAVLMGPSGTTTTIAGNQITTGGVDCTQVDITSGAVVPILITTTTTATSATLGSAVSLPALPAGYLTVNINSTNFKIAYYNS